VVPPVAPPTPGAGRLAFCLGAVLLCVALFVGALPPAVDAAGHLHATPTPSPTPNPPIVISFQIIPAERAAEILRSVYPNARITVDAHANAGLVPYHSACSSHA
jgi:hypothetical protein